MKKAKASGFTLIEILLAVAALVILAGIVILAINPTKQLGDTRNAKRQVDTNTILNAVYQWSIDNNGQIPSGIAPTSTATTTEICKTTGANCSGFTDLGVLTNLETYLVAIPTDPIATTTAGYYGAGYKIYRSVNGRITVVAPLTENGKAIISVTR